MSKSKPEENHDLVIAALGRALTGDKPLLKPTKPLAAGKHRVQGTATVEIDVHMTKDADGDAAARLPTLEILILAFRVAGAPAAEVPDLVRQTMELVKEEAAKRERSPRAGATRCMGEVKIVGFEARN